MIKILFYYEYLGLGGVEVILATRLRALMKSDYQVRAMFMQDAGGRLLFKGMEDSIIIPASPIQKMDALLDFQPDILVSLDTPSIVSAARKLLPNINVFYEIHTTYPQALRPLRNQKFIQQVNHFIVPSKFQAQFVREIINRPDIAMDIVPDPLDERYFSPLEPSIGKANQPIIAWVGRLDNLKNWRSFIEIAARISSKRQDVEFRLIGGLYSPMEEQNALWIQMVKNNLLQQMRWYPSLDPEHMPAMLDEIRNSGGCVVSTSRIESFGMSILEAMGRACPVVVPDGGSLAELAGEQTRGLTYPLARLDEAVQKILPLLDNPTLRQELGEHAREFALQHTWQASNDAFLKAIQSTNP